MTLPRLLDDEQVRRYPAADAVAVMLRTLRAHGAGQLAAPPRVSADLGSDGAMTFTVGALPEVYGYRAYDSLAGSNPQQVVVVHDRESGQVTAIAVGSALGPMRTGAIGGAAVAALTPTQTAELGVIGTGIQAYRQIWAISAVRRLSAVRVYSRDPGRREQFAQRVRDRLGLSVDATDSAEDAVREAGIVVVATSSTTPVLSSSWLRDDVHVNLLGPKADGAAEYPADLVADAALVTTDSLAQLRDYRPPAGEVDRVVELGRFIEEGRQRPPGRSVFHSVGLAGTEVALLGAIATNS
ncbi:ornithine cyclodeaminase family protein [Epidermidibacterium keratini]|uniref:Ornithine cyclodeaminase family protein n=1 Tax=Epidermidibacterium keratini TaxID=1891644 RepID=A0A7L4YMU1_9ACTN|nr:ornithine cyclodeaminase family protein [Epidermidibacterium keratini]QHC00372.1 ornithine cyclodeaminase family protein [Epidermidibacterium keratini]